MREIGRIVRGQFVWAAGLACVAGCATTPASRAVATTEAPTAPSVEPAPAAEAAEPMPAAPAPVASATPGFDLSRAGAPQVVVMQEENVHPDRRHQHVMMLLGERYLSASDWGDLDDQFDFGLTFDKGVANGKISVDFGMYWSGDSSSTTSGPFYVANRVDIFELNVGLLKMLYLEAPVRPYIGAGVALAWASAWNQVGGTFATDTDFTPGMYGRAGLAYQHGSGPMIGVDFHYLGLTGVNLGNFSSNINGWTVSLLLGYGF